MKIELSASAQRDIEKHTRYLLDRHERAARAFLSALNRAFFHLSDYPLTGHLVLLKRRRAPVRRWNINPMAIFYEVRGDVLYIIRVRHGARKPITR